PGPAPVFRPVPRPPVGPPPESHSSAHGLRVGVTHPFGETVTDRHQGHPLFQQGIVHLCSVVRYLLVLLRNRCLGHLVGLRPSVSAASTRVDFPSPPYVTAMHFQ